MKETSQSLRVWIYSRATFDTEERANEIIRYLLAHPAFRPDRFGQSEPLRRFTEDKVGLAVAMLENRPGQDLNPERVLSSILFQRSKHPWCAYGLTWSKLPHRAFEMSTYRVEASYLRQREHLMGWLGFIYGLLAVHDAWYALFALEEETQFKNYLTWRTQHPRARDPAYGVQSSRGVGLELTEGIPGIYWGNYFGSFYVNWFGKEAFEKLPYQAKHWLPSGGMFFTTAPTPFEWNTLEAVQLQQEVKATLGADTFFDIETVRQLVAEFEPIPDEMRPEAFQSPRRVPEFPFKVQRPERKSLEDELADAMRYFGGQGFSFEKKEGSTLTFQAKNGGVLRVTVGPGGGVEYFPMS